MSWTFVAPKRPGWLKWFLTASGTSVVMFVVAAWWAPWAPGRAGGLVAGTVASIIFGIDALYPLRRKVVVWPFRTAQTWIQFHIYGGLFACLLVFLHIGLHWPAGQFGWWLFLLTLWTTGSGLLGVWLQKWIPMVIVNNLTVEALYDRVPALIGRLQAEADRVIAGASEMLERTYQTDLRPLLVDVTVSWSYLFDIRGSRDKRLTPLTHIAQFLGEDERERLADLRAIFTEKTELDAHLSLQRALRLWLVLHVPVSLLLLGLLTIHIVSVLYL